MIKFEYSPRNGAPSIFVECVLTNGEVSFIVYEMIGNELYQIMFEALDEVCKDEIKNIAMEKLT